MKRLILLIFAITLVLCISGCGQKDNQPVDDDQKAGTSQTDVSEKNEFGFKVPAAVAKIDLSKDDPSNEQIKFVFDDEGKISQCYYKVDEKDIYLNYTYKDNKIQIYGFSGDIVVADKCLEVTGEYNSSVGFVEKDGFYIKGYQF